MPPNRLRQSSEAWQDASEPGFRGPAEQGRSIVNRARGWAAPQRHRPGRRRHVRQLLALLSAAAALGLAGCGSSAPALSTSRPTSTPTPSASASPTPDASDAAVLAAYQAYVSAINQAYAATSSPGAWNLPVLSATMVNPMLQGWQNLLTQDYAQGIVVEGTFTPEHPRVVSNSGTSATVSDCLWDATVEYYKASSGGTAEPVPNQPGGTQPEGDGFQAVFTLVSGKWMASAGLSDEAGNCTGF